MRRSHAQREPAGAEVVYFPSAQQTGPSEPALDIKRLLLLRTPLMLLVAVLVGLPALWVAWHMSPGNYIAEAEIRFLASTPRVMEARGTRETPYDKFLTTQLQLITSTAVMNKVLESPEVASMQWLTALPDPVGLLRKAVRAEVQRNSELVTVSCKMRDGEAAKRILDAVIAVYLDYASSEEADAGGERLRILTQERRTLETDLEKQLGDIAELQGSVGVPTSGDRILASQEADLYRENLVREELEVTRAKEQILEMEAKVEEIDAYVKANDGGPIYAFAIEERVATDPKVIALQEQVALAESEVAQLDERLASEAPKLKVERSKADALKRSLASAEAGARKDVVNTLRADFQTQLQLAKNRLASAEGQADRFRQLLVDYDGRVQDATTQLASVEKMKAQAQETEDMLRNIRRQITETSLESNAPARVRLVSPAFVPAGGPDYSKRKKLMLLALMGTLGLAGLVGIWRERTDRSVRSAREVYETTRVPVVAAIPHVKEDRLVTTTMHYALAVDCPISKCADEIRRVLVHVLFPADGASPLRSILVTSPTQGDGKTFVAYNLANALAQANQRVLLMDLSIRTDDRLDKHFKVKPATFGADEDLGRQFAGSFSRTQSSDNLWIMRPGIQPDELVNKLGSGEMVAFLERAEHEFDHVIIDTMSLLLLSDAQLLAPLVDGVVVVAGAGESNTGMLRRCLGELHQVRANVIGVVLNKLRRTRGGYMGENLKLHYDTYSGSRTPQQLAPPKAVQDPKHGASKVREHG